MIQVTNEILLKYLKELGVIEPNKLQEAYDFSLREHKDLRDTLLERDWLTDENLGKAIADLYGAPYIQLGKIVILHEVLALVPEEVARFQQVIAFKKDAKGLHVAMHDPHNLEVIDNIQKKTLLKVVAYYVSSREILTALALYSKEVGSAFEQILSEHIGQVRLRGTGEPPIIKIVDTIFEYAYRNRASDIHIEPFKDKTLVRFRIDGILHDIVTLPQPLHTSMVTRIKVQARLRTDEHFAAQDGKLQLEVDGDEVDVRVSIVPSVHGEKVVMRILSAQNRQFALEDLGLQPKDLMKVLEAYKRPYGMVLSTGPTGSGKTTTMYAILKLLNSREVNISTIEDPVEYEIEGVTQIQVNPKTNLTFAKGLKSILRQDPNIILVGEIRDEETADIALNAAMTGHLVLSTLHTNNAATAIPRLAEMKVVPYQIATTVNVVMAQRLMRRICQKCRVSIEHSHEELTKMLPHGVLDKHFIGTEKTRLYIGKGCQICHGSGYKGRVGIFEILIVSQKIREAIVENRDSQVIKAIAVAEGMSTMLDDGMLKVKEGQSTIEEVLRVTAE